MGMHACGLGTQNKRTVVRHGTTCGAGNDDHDICYLEPLAMKELQPKLF